MRASSCLIALVLALAEAHDDEAHGGKGEKDPTPGLPVSKFTVSHALDDIFDGEYTATGQKIKGFDVYKGGQHGSKYLYPNTVGDGTLHYIWDTNFNPKDGVLGGMLIKSGDGLPIVRGKGPEMHGRRKGFGESFRWNPDIVIAPDADSTESCVSFGFGAMMVPCCETCAPADSGLCEADKPKVGGNTKAFQGMDCDAALDAWRAEEKAKADAAAAAAKKAEEEAAAKAAAELAARLAAAKKEVEESAEKNGVPMGDVAAAAGAADGAYTLDQGATADDAAAAAGKGAAIFGSEEDATAAEDLVKKGSPVVATSEKAKSAYDDAILTDDTVPANAGTNAAIFAKTLEGTGAEVAAAAGAAAGKIESSSASTDDIQVAIEAAKAAAASGGVSGDALPNSVVAAIAGHAAGEVGLDEGESADEAAADAAAATTAAGGNSALASQVKDLTAAGQTAQKGVHGSAVQELVNEPDNKAKIADAADAADAGAAGAVEASDAGNDKIVIAKTAGEFAGLKVEDDQGTPQLAGEEAAKAAIASPVSVKAAEMAKLMAQLEQKPQLGATRAAPAPKKKMDGGVKFALGFSIALIACVALYAVLKSTASSGFPNTEPLALQTQQTPLPEAQTPTTA